MLIRIRHGPELFGTFSNINECEQKNYLAKLYLDEPSFTLFEIGFTLQKG